MDTKLTIKLPEELSRRAKARAASQGLSLDEVIRRYLEEFIDELAQFKTTDGDLSSMLEELKRPVTPEEVKASFEGLARLRKLGEEISKTWPEGLSAADAIKQDRREL